MQNKYFLLLHCFSEPLFALTRKNSTSCIRRTGQGLVKGETDKVQPGLASCRWRCQQSSFTTVALLGRPGFNAKNCERQEKFYWCDPQFLNKKTQFTYTIPRKEQLIHIDQPRCLKRRLVAAFAEASESENRLQHHRHTLRKEGQRR